MFLKYFVILALFAVTLHGLDYCDKSLCKKGKHIACNHKGTFKSHCPDGIRLVSMNSNMQNIFLNQHNLVRDLVAGGKHPRGFDRAARMCSMVWDPTLAYFATLNVYNCNGLHDDCRAHPNFPSIGQNLYEGYDSNPITAESVIEKAVQRWHKEAEKTSKHQLSKLNGASGIGHFTQLVNDRACKIGCAVALWDVKKRHQFYVVCNYSFGNLVETSAYKVKGDKCKKGYHPDHRNLCHPDEAHIIHEATMNEK